MAKLKVHEGNPDIPSVQGYINVVDNLATTGDAVSRIVRLAILIFIHRSDDNVGASLRCQVFEILLRSSFHAKVGR